MTNPMDEEGERFRSLQDRAAVSIWLLTDEEQDELNNELEDQMIEETTTAPEHGKLNTLSLEMAVRVQHELKQLGDVRSLAEVSDMTEDQAAHCLRQAVRDSAAHIAMVAL